MLTDRRIRTLPYSDINRCYFSKTAGNAVKTATQSLVDAAKEAIEDDAAVNVEIPGSMVQSIAQEMQAMEVILAKERELKAAQNRLLELRKKKYQQQSNR